MKFAALLTLDDGAEALTTKFNAVVTKRADEILGKNRRKTQPWVTDDILYLCDQRRNLKKAKSTTSGAEAYREVSKKIRKGMRVVKRRLDTKQCTEIEVNLHRNNSKRAFQVMNNFTKQRQSRVNTVQDKQGKCLTEEQVIVGRWTEYAQNSTTTRSGKLRFVCISPKT